MEASNSFELAGLPSCGERTTLEQVQPKGASPRGTVIPHLLPATRLASKSLGSWAQRASEDVDKKTIPARSYKTERRSHRFPYAI